jgi:hypothetical protein
MISAAVADDESIAQTRARVCAVLGRLLCSTEERPLSALDAFAADERNRNQDAVESLVDDIAMRQN